MSLAASLSVAMLLMGLLAVTLIRRAIMKDVGAIDDVTDFCEEAPAEMS